MLDSGSRYAKLPVLEYKRLDGTSTAYLSRRFLPPAESLPLLAEVTVQDGERPDLLTARTMGDPTVFWRVADANEVMDPAELVEEPGRKVRIPSPRP